MITVSSSNIGGWVLRQVQRGDMAVVTVHNDPAVIMVPIPPWVKTEADMDRYIDALRKAQDESGS